MAEPVLSLRDVHVRFDTPRGPVHAVRGVDLDLHAGETLAIVGESGAGKSALAKAVLRLNQPPFTPNRTHVSGTIALRAPFEAELAGAPERVLRDARARAVGMVFQEALSALNPVQRVGPQITEALRLSGRPAKPATEVPEILGAIGLPERAARAFPHQLSGGQCQRVMIAVAAVRHPVALIADEPTTALDVTVQAQILALLKSLQRMRGMGVLFISHDLGVVAEIADRVAVMREGRVVEEAPTGALFTAPRHPYTRALLAARPSPRTHAPAPSAEPVLRMEGVTFAHPSGLFGGAPAPVLKDISLTVAAGEVHGLVGESGSGKSTLGRLALGFLAPQTGRIETCGTVPHRARGRILRSLRRAVSVVHQDSASALNPRMTLGRSAAEGLHIHDHPAGEVDPAVRRLFDRVGLPHALMERFPHQVSGGQRQRVCIARALATGPRLLIADEPVTALDLSVQARILDLFAELRAELGLAMLIISHDLEVVHALCDRVSVLHRGRIVEHGPTEAVFHRPEAEHTRALVASLPGRPPASRERPEAH